MNDTPPTPVTAATDHEHELTTDELLAGLPAMIPPGRLRARYRNEILRIGRVFEGIFSDGIIDLAHPHALDVFAEIDDFGEAITLDKAAYIAWAETASYAALVALLARYVEAVGESMAS